MSPSRFPQGKFSFYDGRHPRLHRPRRHHPSPQHLSSPLPVFAILGSQLSDTNTSTNLIGQICFLLSQWIEDHYPHCTVAYSLLAAIALLFSLIILHSARRQLATGLSFPLGLLLARFTTCSLNRASCCSVRILPGEAASAIPGEG